MIPDYTASSFFDLVSLEEKTAAVTGGAKGIGAAVCTRLAELGADVAIGDLDVDAAEALCETLRSRFGTRVTALHLDVRDSASVEAFADAALALSGGLDIWINNAGIFPHSTILNTSGDAWDDVIDINLKGTFLGTKAAAARMTNLPPGGASRCIVNMASMNAFFGREGRSHYAASKHGVVGLTKSAAREFGSAGIRVLAIAPTMVSTPGLDAFNQRSSGGTGGAIADMVVSRIPLGRICVPDDIARVVAFCCTELASMMSGSALLVDGGFGTG